MPKGALAKRSGVFGLRYVTGFIAMTSLFEGAAYILYFLKTIVGTTRFNRGLFVPKIAQTSLCLQRIVNCRHEFIRALRQERLLAAIYMLRH